jgi:ferredoxin
MRSVPIEVTILRPECIACCNCHTECPEVFELDPEDGLSSIRPKYRTDAKDLARGTIPEKLRESVQRAADICPVQIIHVTKSTTTH